MHRARCAQQWDHTANLMALLANTVRDPKKKRSPWSANDFHPLRRKQTFDRCDEVASSPGGNWSHFREACEGIGWLATPE